MPKLHFHPADLVPRGRPFRKFVDRLEGAEGEDVFLALQSVMLQQNPAYRRKAPPTWDELDSLQSDLRAALPNESARKKWDRLIDGFDAMHGANNEAAYFLGVAMASGRLEDLGPKPSTSDRSKVIPLRSWLGRRRFEKAYSLPINLRAVVYAREQFGGAR